jgi:16S rRNA (guanine527-N7)-methyltransferase
VKASEFELKLRRQTDRAGLSISADFVVRAERYYELLKRWNRTTNLTALHLDEYSAESIDRLLVEPLRAVELVPLDVSLVCIDVGSGGGSPAIPFALARPAIRLVMVESVAKKAAFLREAIREVELSRVEVITARVEDIAVARPHSAELILSRGVRMSEALGDALVHLLAPGGQLFLFGGSPPRILGLSSVNRLNLGTDNDLLILQAV